MPVRHNWEVKIGNDFLPAKDKAQVLALAKSALKTGQNAVIYENGEESVLNNKISGKTEDTFSHEVRLELHKLQFRMSSLAQEFENGIEDYDLYDEISQLRIKFQTLEDKIIARGNYQRPIEVDPFLVEQEA